MANERRILKVISWRILSTILCTLIGRIWFGDWHVTFFGLFLAFSMTFVHYLFEWCWSKLGIRNVQT